MEQSFSIQIASKEKEMLSVKELSEFFERY
jgi:hypothetical protein